MGLGILVVDDNQDCLKSTAKLLELMGHEVWTVDHAEAVCDEARKHEPDLILLDIGMPGMSGYEIAQQLRTNAANRHAIVVAFSGFATENDKRKALAAGFDDHIAKPMEMATLERLLDSIGEHAT